MTATLDVLTLNENAERGATAAQRLCDGMAQAKQGLRNALLREDRQRLYEDLAQQVQDATDDALLLGLQIGANEGWCVGFLETLGMENPQLLDRAVTHGLKNLWLIMGQTCPSVPKVWVPRRQSALNKALECLVDNGSPRAAIEAMLVMGADPMAHNSTDHQPVWHTSLTREAQADVERHVDLLLSTALGIHSQEGLVRLNRALDATVNDLTAVLEQDDRELVGVQMSPDGSRGEDTLREAGEVVFREMHETAVNISLDDNDPLDEVRSA